MLEFDNINTFILKKLLIDILIIVSVFIILFTSCRDENYFASDDVRLVFSHDTVKFDTIFTSIGSTTKSLRVINPHNRPILISSISLAGGDQSSYRLNIDGEMTNELKDIELLGNDSIFIFVELTVDPNGYNQPMIVQDSILFTINSKTQDVDLIAWGQDFFLIDNEMINTTTWTADKPYLVYNSAYVDTGHVLTIEPGARIFFHKNAVLGVLGSIQAVGTVANPIVFSADRLELMYDDIPDQWHGILLFPSQQLNVFENVTIKNARIALQVGTIEYDGAAYVKLHNVKIQHASFAGIFALKSQIEATNTLIADCGLYAVALLIGGSYDFNHCTIANYWSSYSTRETASLAISNRLFINENGDSVEYVGDLVKSTWRNSIIWGNQKSEIEFGHNKNNLFNVEFDNCLYQLKDSLQNIYGDLFTSSIRDEDPLFVDYNEYDFQLDSLSPAINAGKLEYGKLVPADFNGISRLDDKAPDLGAYEYIDDNE